MCCLFDLSFQSKSLIGDQSIVFSPPSIIKETLHDDTDISLNDAFALPCSPLTAVNQSLNTQSKVNKLKSIQIFTTFDHMANSRNMVFEVTLSSHPQNNFKIIHHARIYFYL